MTGHEPLVSGAEGRRAVDVPTPAWWIRAASASGTPTMQSTRKGFEFSFLWEEAFSRCTTHHHGEKMDAWYLIPLQQSIGNTAPLLPAATGSVFHAMTVTRSQGTSKGLAKGKDRGKSGQTTPVDKKAAQQQKAMLRAAKHLLR